MRDFELTWIREGKIPDLNLEGVLGTKAYISESEALGSEDFRKARREGFIEVQAVPFAKRKFSKPVENFQSNNTLDLGALESILTRVLSPVIENQSRIIELLESRNISRPSSQRERKESSPKKPHRRVNVPEIPNIPLPIEFAEVSFGNEIKQESTEDGDADSTLQSISKLKQLRKKT